MLLLLFIYLFFQFLKFWGLKVWTEIQDFSRTHRRWVHSHILRQDANRCVSLSPPCHLTLELSVESKFDQSVLLYSHIVFGWNSLSLTFLTVQLLVTTLSCWNQPPACRDGDHMLSDWCLLILVSFWSSSNIVFHNLMTVINVKLVIGNQSVTLQ